MLLIRRQGVIAQELVVQLRVDSVSPAPNLISHKVDLLLPTINLLKHLLLNCDLLLKGVYFVTLDHARVRLSTSIMIQS